MYEALDQGVLHSCLSVNYQQKHKKELLYASRLCTRLGIKHHTIDLSALKPFMMGSALTDQVTMPEGHYTAENMKLTVVPNRNMILLSVAIAYAISHKLMEVRFGAHSGDHDIYPDCREGFVKAMNAAAAIANWHPIRVTAPYINFDKAAILNIGIPLGLDYGWTWTCYQGGDLACGKCGACQERLEAFMKIRRIDPLKYEREDLA